MHECSQVSTVVNAEALSLCVDGTSGLISKRTVNVEEEGGSCGGGSSILRSLLTLITPVWERDTAAQLRPSAASRVCILMSINYLLNETIK